MLCLLDDRDIRLLDNSDKIIGKCKRVEIGDYQYIEPEELLGIIENLIGEIEHIKEEYEDLQNNLESNYKPISAWEMSGMSERDFV